MGFFFFGGGGGRGGGGGGGTKEDTPVSAITTLSEAFWIEGFTISITWSWVLKQWREFNKGRAIDFLVDEWVTPDFGNRCQEKILHATVNYKCYWITKIST